MRTIVVLVVGILAVAPMCAEAEDLDDTQVSFRGWLDTDFRGNDKPGNKPFIDAHHLYLITEATMAERYRAFAEVEIEHAPNTSGGKGTLKLERLYSEVAVTEGFGVRIGKFNTPFGYWTPTHWAILVETVEKPIHENNKYVPPKSVGVEAFGRIFVGENDIEWNAFISNGSEFEATNKPQDRTFGGGIDARLNFLNGDAFVGGSAYNQRNPSRAQRRETSFVGYAGFAAGNFHARGEFILQDRKEGGQTIAASEQASLLSEVNTFYVNGMYFVMPEVAFGARYDEGEDDKSGSGDRHQIKTAYVNWRPIHRVIGKVEYNVHTFDADGMSDYNSWAAYFGIVF